MKRFLNKPKTRAALWMADCAIYLLFSEMLRIWGIRLGAVFALLIGMYCAAECFSCGREYERQLWGVRETEAPDTEPMTCQVCGCSEFTEAAGRYICACCGAVLETDAGGSAHGEERKV